jgi:HAMP domain-containing protein
LAPTTEIRLEIAHLTEKATGMVLASQRLDTYLSFALFLLACGIGFGISAVGSTQVVGGLRKLLATTRAIEAGAESVPVSVHTRDEVGELALSFNRMVEELRSRERIKDTFGKFVDPRIVSRLIGSGADQAERRTLTIFFSDIKEFSGISEQLTASAIVNLLNSYFGAVAAVIHGTSIVLSEETFRLAQEVIEARELDLITVAGKTEPVRIYEAMCRAGELGPEQSELRQLFADGLAAYRQRNWDEAQTQFEKCLRIAAEDGPAQLFLERILVLRQAPPPADWGGVWRFAEK